MFIYLDYMPNTPWSCQHLGAPPNQFFRYSHVCWTPRLEFSLLVVCFEFIKSLTEVLCSFLLVRSTSSRVSSEKLKLLVSFLFLNLGWFRNKSFEDFNSGISLSFQSLFPKILLREAGFNSFDSFWRLKNSLWATSFPKISLYFFSSFTFENGYYSKN